MNSPNRFFRLTYLVFIFFVLTAAFLLWNFAPKTESATRETEREDLSNYDIRSDKSETAEQAIEKFAAQSDKKQSVRADAKLRSKIPNLKLEYNEDLRIPEIIAPDSAQNADFLTAPDNGKRTAILRSFLKQNSELIGLNDLQIDALKTTADYTNPDGNLSFVHFEQRINDVPVFRVWRRVQHGTGIDKLI